MDDENYNAEARAETARLYGMITTMRYLLEQTWALILMQDADPLAACDRTARAMLNMPPRRPEGQVEQSSDPDFDYAVVQASEDEMERFFRSVRGHIESELEIRRRQKSVDE